MATTQAAAPTIEEIVRDSKERGIEFYFAQFVDMYARPSAKLIPAANLDDLISDGAGFAGFAAGEICQFPSDPDVAAIPDLASYTPVPWEPNLARFACDVHVEGEEWPYCPRTILRRRGSISATSEALYVHPNTLRQRLRRILDLSGIDLRKDDWLMIEIAVKLVKLQKALGPAAAHTNPPERL